MLLLRFGLLLGLLAPLPASAWWDAGHTITGVIAHAQMTPNTRAKTLELLRRHPRFAQDFLSAMPPSVRESDPTIREQWLFSIAALWPDLAREFQGNDRDLYHRSTWHYINLPVWLDDASRAALEADLPINQSTAAPREVAYPITENETIRRFNVAQALTIARQVLADEAAPDADRAIMLCWLFHLVGDLHQPMHSSAMVSRRLFPTGDRGGNDIAVRIQGTIDYTNLHFAWDSLLGSRTPFADARKKAYRFLQNPELAASGRAAVESLEVWTWLQESRRLAQEHAYTPEVRDVVHRFEAENRPRPQVVLSKAYMQNAGQIAQHRVTEAGFRIAAVLNQSFDPPPPES